MNVSVKQRRWQCRGSQRHRLPLLPVAVRCLRVLLLAGLLRLLKQLIVLLDVRLQVQVRLVAWCIGGAIA